MPWVQILIALLPIPVFYLVYYRYFTFKPELIKHVEGFLSGIGFALLLLFLGSALRSQGILVPHGSIFQGFVYAALVEKIGALLILILIQLYYPNFSALESILSAILFGLGFSLAENLSYAMNYGYNVVLVRVLLSVPLHLTTCGILGYYLGLSKMSKSWNFRLLYAFKALVLSIAIHGTFDSLLLSGGYASYIAIPILLLTVIILEVLMARSQTILPHTIISALNMRFEDWLLMYRQPRYDRWIIRSLGTAGDRAEPFFQWQPGILRFIAVILLMITALVCLSFRQEIVALLRLNLTNEDQIIILGIFPFSIGLIIILVGAINPAFFTSSTIRIPIIADVQLADEAGTMQEISVSYNFSSASCFIKTSEPLGIGRRISIAFEYLHHSSPSMETQVLWENHTNPRTPQGSILRIVSPPPGFVYVFLARYYFARMLRGIIFALRLPGFETIRKLFTRPISTMQDVTIFKAGSIIYSQGDPAHQFYLIKKGKIIFYKTLPGGEIITIDTAEDEQIFGEMAVFSGTAHDLTAQCITDCVIAVAEKERLSALIQNNTDFAIQLFESLASRIQMSHRVILENLNSIEKEKIERETVLNAMIMICAMGTAGSLKGNSVTLPIKLAKVSRAVANMDRKMIREIIDLYHDHGSIDYTKRDRLIRSLNDIIARYRLIIRM